MYVLGLSPSKFDDDKAINSLLVEVRLTFDLVMIHDGVYFNQSLILLKHLMNWTTEDIVTLTVNKQVTCLFRDRIHGAQKFVIGPFFKI